MSWFYLFFAGLFEVGWVIGLKKSEGFSKPVPTLVTLVLMAVSFGLLSMALRKLPMGAAYAIWTGIGAVGAAAIGIVFYGEPRDTPRIICLGLIFAGIVGLKVLTKAE